MISLFSYLKNLKIIASFLIVIGIAALWIWGVRYEQARARDLQRMADALIIQTAFEQMYQHDRSYGLAAYNGCDEAGMSVRRCQLRDYYLDINILRDPGKYDYNVTEVPTETSYEITFWLEKDHDDFAKGVHTISPEGIK